MRETPKAAAAYAQYAAMGPARSLRKLHQQMLQTDRRATPRLRTLNEWSSQHGWQDRVKQHDLDEALAEEQERLRLVREMNKRQRLLGVTQQSKALDQIKALIAAKKFGSQATVMLLKLAIDTERVALETPTAIMAQQLSGALALDEHVAHDFTFEDDPDAAQLARALIAHVSTKQRSADDAAGE